MIHLSLPECFEIINSTVGQLNRGRGEIADALRKVFALFNGDSTVKVNLDLSPADIVKLNVTSAYVERSIS
ncbi:hypothetical protein C0J52_19544 [Blattella germanica]|nr:hypothetical protein C0J52_19544 [Blattella germanica]